MLAYRFHYVLSPKLSEDDAKNWEGKFENLIADIGGKVSLREVIRKENLAHPIKKERVGYRGSVEFVLESEGKKAPAILDQLKHETGILRLILIRKEDPKRVKKVRKAPPRKVATAAPEAPVAVVAETAPSPILSSGQEQPALPGTEKAPIEQLDKALDELLG